MIKELRDSGFTVELLGSDQIRLRPQCPVNLLKKIKAAKPEIIRALIAEQSPLYVVKTSPQLRGLAIIPDDRRFIESCVNNKTSEEVIALLSEYRSHWLDAATTEKLTHCKDNAGRFAANTWLRENT